MVRIFYEMWNIVFYIFLWIVLTVSESQPPIAGGPQHPNVYLLKDYYILNGGQLFRSPFGGQGLSFPSGFGAPLQSHQSGGSFAYSTSHILNHGQVPKPHLVLSPLSPLFPGLQHLIGPSPYHQNVQPGVRFPSHINKWAGWPSSPSLPTHFLRYPMGQVPAVPYRVFFAGSLTRDGQQCELSHYPKEKGACHDAEHCLSLGGSPNDRCNVYGQPLRCCIFRKSCGSSSNSTLIYFRNENYPLYDNYATNCGITVEKQSNACSVRVDVDILNHPVRGDTCNIKAFHVSSRNSNLKYEPLCVKKNETYSVDFEMENNLYFEMKHDTPISVFWKISLSQIPCGQTAPTTKPWPKAGQGATSTSTSQSQPGSSSSGSSSSSSPGTGSSSSSIPSSGSSSSSVPSSGTSGVVSHPSTSPGSSSTSGASGTSTKHPVKPAVVGSTPFKCGGRMFNKNQPAPILKGDPESSSPGLEQSIPTLKESLFYKYSRNTLLTNRITSGKATHKLEFPWQVAMYNVKYGRNKFHCGASVIGEKHVITASHCVRGFEKSPRYLKLLFGDWALGTQEDFKDIVIDIDKIFPHEGFSMSTLQHDIAVIKLKKKLTFSERVQPICLPTRAMDNEKLYTLTGWGRDENNRLQKFMKKLSAASVPTKKCNQSWKKMSKNVDLIVSTHLCLSSQFGDSCKGDSGGPVCVQEASGKFTQVALTSFGSKSCQDASLPGVYTKLFPHVKWIKEKMKL